MLLATIGVLAMMLSGGGNPPTDNPPKTAKPAKASIVHADYHADQSEQEITFDAEAEQRLLQLTNVERARAGQPSLVMDEGLTAAARTHAAHMAEQATLSHQLPGEAPLQQRLAPSSLQLDTMGENVALDVDIDQAHEGLMHSPPHRENILRAAYNVAGFGVARVGDRFYVVEDFGHSLPTFSIGQAENAVAEAVVRARGEDNRPQLKRLQLGSLRDAACNMAGQDRLNPKALNGLGPLRYVLTFTDMNPDTLPTTADKVIDDRGLSSFAVGACFARTGSYPNGAYWVTVVFY
jgi:uncharacterized protein YkwD